MPVGNLLRGRQLRIGETTQFSENDHVGNITHKPGKESFKSDQIVFVSVSCGRCTGGDIQFGENIAHMSVYGSFTDI
jgi:hypothetical protein